jgi:hypothetical protein
MGLSALYYGDMSLYAYSSAMVLLETVDEPTRNHPRPVP